MECNPGEGQSCEGLSCANEPSLHPLPADRSAPPRLDTPAEESCGEDDSTNESRTLDPLQAAEREAKGPGQPGPHAESNRAGEREGHRPPAQFDEDLSGGVWPDDEREEADGDGGGR